MSDASTPRLAVLLVDDDAELSAILSDRLRGRGYAVTVRGTAAGALELVREQDFDVVIADVDLPGMDGPSSSRSTSSSGAT
jgi:CheY-like chemotaxis protein